MICSAWLSQFYVNDDSAWGRKKEWELPLFCNYAITNPTDYYGVLRYYNIDSCIVTSEYQTALLGYG